MTRRYWFPKHYADVVQRLRVPLGFVMLALFAYAAAPTRVSLWMGLPVALFGVWIRAWAAGHLEKNQKLTTSGPYRWVRNPLYVGTFLAAMGFGIAANQWWLPVLFGIVFVLVYLPAIELEEQKLRELFEDFDAYAASVPLVVPRGPKIDSPGLFRWGRYLKNEEYNALAGCAVGALYLAWKAGVIGW